MDRPHDETVAIINFLSEAYRCTGEIVAIMYRASEGRFSDDVLAAIHERLEHLSDAALDVPERISALAQVDRLAAMFPPRNKDRRGG